MPPQSRANDAADQIQFTLRAAACPLLLRIWKTNKASFINYCTISFVAPAAATGPDQSTAARFCSPSPPTEGWRPSSWRGPCLPCGSPRSPSCSFPQACAAAPSWPSTSRTPLRTPARCHLNEWINEWQIRWGEWIWKKVEREVFCFFFGNWDVDISDVIKDK